MIKKIILESDIAIHIIVVMAITIALGIVFNYLADRYIKKVVYQSILTLQVLYLQEK